MIGISSCIVGEACRFDGTKQDLEKALMLEKYGNTVRVCPEVLGGLTTPRNPAEIVKDKNINKVISIKGEDVTKEFKLGALKTLEICVKNNIKYFILKDRSPSCGKGQIYNGKFEGQLIEGNGLTSQLLLDHGVQVFNSSQAPYEKLLVYDFLNENNVAYEQFKHEPVFTVEEDDKIQIDMKTQHCKNLFLESKNKKEKILVILPSDKRFNFKEVEEKLGIKRLRFGSKESLKESLGVEAGSVGAFGLLYDIKREVKVVISSQFNEEESISFHPNINDETLSISYKNLMKIFKKLGYQPLYID